MAETNHPAPGVGSDPGIARAFARLFATMALAFLGLLSAYLMFQTGMDDDRHRDALVATVNRTADLVLADLDSHANDIRILAALAPLRAYAHGDESARPGMIRIFSAFVEQKESIAQLRYLDATGREQVRVDGAGGVVTVVPDGELQDKSDRYYFRDSIDLPPTDIYVSPLDLNIERGQIELPWNPMIRLARTIGERDGKTRGEVVVNIHAGEMLNLLTNASRGVGETLEWINGDGYWLAGAKPGQLWGFMFERDTTMAKSHPQVWAKISAERGSGVVRAGGTTWVFRTVSPGRALSESGRDAGPAADWKFIGTMQERSFLGLWTRPRLGLAASGLALIGLTCFGWSSAAAARHRAEAREKAAERELVEFERLASLGGLVAGVAHELNTPVGNAVTVASTIAERIRGFRAELAAGALRRTTLDTFLDDLDNGATLMLRGLDRTARLVQQFKQVAVDQTSQQRRAFSVGDLVHDVAATLGPQFKHSAARLVIRVESDAQLDSYPGPFGQVVMNLVANARIHAFASEAPGTIDVSVRRLDPASVELKVTDDGVGMPEAVRQRVFEPFFTTRLGEGGSGLGLSIVHNIVTGVLGGSVGVESAPGKGTTVTVRVPRVAPSEPRNGRIYDVTP